MEKTVETPGKWTEASVDLRGELARLLDADDLRALHETSGWRHGLIGARQFLLAAGCTVLIVRYDHLAWVWLPAAVLLGFVLFSFTVLLHEVVHRTVLKSKKGRLNAALAWLYALPTGLAAAQFERWHLDHHAELGSEVADPKRHHLTPKIVRRWYKALYMTPALFAIYFRAAARENRTYETPLQTRIRRQRSVTMALHLAVGVAIVLFWNWAVLVKLYVIPLFFVFPIAFTVNRLGQHYDIDPADPAAWGTIIKTNPLWDFLYLWSSYHMEHHYFPGVPFYKLPALHRTLKPVLDRHPMRVRTYTGLLWDWFIRNRQPHTHW
jgi:fatty acid desaturase